MCTVANADKIIELNNGKIAEQGTSQELMNHNGLFKIMVELQKLSGE